MAGKFRLDGGEGLPERAGDDPAAEAANDIGIRRRTPLGGHHEYQIDLRYVEQPPHGVRE